MLVYMLWRVKSREAEETLVAALADGDVALHAGSALRRLIGNERAAKRLETLIEHEGERVARAARSNLQRARKALARRPR